jgi:hypothetical protein
MFCVWALKALQNSMMLTPCWPSAGPTGGLGFALPAGICSLMYPVTFFAMTLYLCVGPDASRLPFGFLPCASRRAPSVPGRPRSGLLDLAEIQLDRRRPAEDLHGDAQLALVVVDLFDGAVEVVEGPVVTRTTSPGSNSTFGPRLLGAFLDPLQDGIGLASVIGAGRSLEPPMNPSTFGTSFTRCQVSSSSSICTST